MFVLASAWRIDLLACEIRGIPGACLLGWIPRKARLWPVMSIMSAKVAGLKPNSMRVCKWSVQRRRISAA